MIEVRGLTKRYGDKVAVDELSFTVQPGRVTGFLGPNGAGKSTTMRVVLGLDRPTAGDTRVNGAPYATLRAPLREVGALLDAGAVHPGRTARAHLLALAASNAIPPTRVAEVLEQVGLGSVAGARVRGFSLGMRQRLGLAAALLGDPATLILDEPVNGLDTEGIRWIRGLLRRLAAEGRTVLLSSHLMSEMELTADHLVVIGLGRLVADTTVREVIGRGASPVTVVRSPRWEELRHHLERLGGQVAPDPGGGGQVRGPDAAAIGELAARHDIPLHELAPHAPSLEDVFTQLTGSSLEHRARLPDAAPVPASPTPEDLRS
ncbi:MAG: ATP-binding cassette domain-containing protein [Acidimicrobiia bacterium]|nr:ATP-binding cassette domain-containing protein [Acidimicrobiia bacterium]